MKYIKLYCILLITANVFAIEPAKVKLEPLPKFRGDEIIASEIIPYLGGRQSPGDSIGITWYDMQGYNFGQRLIIDSRNQAHINWMKRDEAGDLRYCAWNARYANGTYFGETQASPSWSGYVKIDVTRDANPDSQRTVITYHYDFGLGHFSWIDIDASNLAGSWPNDPKTPEYVEYIWPCITVASNNNIIMATNDYNADKVHLFLTTDEGETWTHFTDVDSISKVSHFLRASRNPGSQKVIFAWTQIISDSGCGYDSNVWYMLSTDNGVNWGPHINITDYQPYPEDSVRAYVSANAIFDLNDNIHIVWGGRKVTNINYYDASKIFHWDEINDTITIVSSPSIYYNEPGGWWITREGGYSGAYHMPACNPQLIIDPVTGCLYCLWIGNDDTTDISAAGYPNSEIYGAFSIDNGITWSHYVNLTNTRSPGAPAGECMDEDYMTANPFVVNDSIYITYIEDKDAGSMPHGEGVATENPVRCWVFPKSLIGVEEHNENSPRLTTMNVYPNPFSKQTKICFGIEHPDRIENSSYGTSSLESIELNIYDITGYLVKSFRLTPDALHPTRISWQGDDNFGRKLPAGVYFIQITSDEFNLSTKIIKID